MVRGRCKAAADGTLFRRAGAAARARLADPGACRNRRDGGDGAAPPAPTARRALTILQAATRYADGMNAVPPNFPPASSLAQGAVCMKWAALQEAGAVVCALAGEEPEKSSAEVRNFPAMI